MCVPPLPHMNKTTKNFRVSPELVNYLACASELSGLTQTRILEDAIRLYRGNDEAAEIRREGIMTLLERNGIITGQPSAEEKRKLSDRRDAARDLLKRPGKPAKSGK